MAFALQDRVRETSTTAGAGNLTLAGAVPTFRSFASVFANGDTFYYVIVNRDASSEWEIGFGSWGTGGVLTRTTVLSSSNGGAAVTFSAGTKDITIAYPAAKAVFHDMNGDVAVTRNVAAVQANLSTSANLGTNVAQSGFVRLQRSTTQVVSRNNANSADLTLLGVDTSNNLLVNNGTINFSSSGHVLAGTDNSYDLGSPSAFRLRDFYLARNAAIGGTLAVSSTSTFSALATFSGSGASTAAAKVAGAAYLQFFDGTPAEIMRLQALSGNFVMTLQSGMALVLGGHFGAYTDNVIDLGQSGANRFRNMYLAGNATIGGSVTVTGTISGSFSGNATTATTLQTARAINGVSFDGSAAITVTAAAGTLTGTTLNTTVVTSSLTAVGALSSGSIAAGFGGASLGGNLFATTDATVDIGASSANRFRNMYLSGNVTLGGAVTATSSGTFGTSVSVAGSGAFMFVQTTSSTNPFYGIKNSSGTYKGFLFWDTPSDCLYLNKSGGTSDGVGIDSSGKVFIGTDPGGSELLRVGGSMRVNTTLTASGGNFNVANSGGNIALGVTISANVGIYNKVAFAASGTSYQVLQQGTFTAQATGDTYYGYYSGDTFALNGKATNSYVGINIAPAFTGSGSVATVWGLLIPALPTATQKVAIQTSDPVYFGSNTIIGTDPGGAGLLRVGGTAMASTGFSVPLTQKVQFNNGGTSYSIRVDSGAAMRFETNATDRMTIDSSGAVIVGTDPGGTELLRIGGSVRSTGNLTLSSTNGSVVVMPGVNYAGCALNAGGVNIANLGTLIISPNSHVCVAIITANADGTSAIVAFKGGANAVVIIASTGSWGTTLGAANNYNVYYDGSGNYKIENRSGGVCTFTFTRIGSVSAL